MFRPTDRSATTTTGNFEFVQVASVPSGTQINLSTGLARSYAFRVKYRWFRVPRYSTFTINSGASVTCPAWDGTTGGIVAIGMQRRYGHQRQHRCFWKRISRRCHRTKHLDSGNFQRPGAHHWIPTAQKKESIAGPANGLSNGRLRSWRSGEWRRRWEFHNGGGGGGCKRWKHCLLEW